MIALVVSIIIQIMNKVGLKQVFKKMHCKLSQFFNCFIEAKSWFFVLKRNIMQTILKNLYCERIISHFMAFMLYTSIQFYKLGVLQNILDTAQFLFTWYSWWDCSTEGKDCGPSIVLLREFLRTTHSCCDHVWFQ